MILQKTTNKNMENSCPTVTATEEQIDKTYLDILRKKISVNSSLLSQDDRINKVSAYNLNWFVVLKNKVMWST